MTAIAAPMIPASLCSFAGTTVARRPVSSGRNLSDFLLMPPMQITIDPKLKAKCPRTTLACLTARVEAGASPAALLAEIKAL